ncbi:hypothetical protein OBBRIDRAFT_798679 [Obba rivulosa]|uniref:F-box domain-containing protein n=1 Tax=Obba rivulosa TaxID=1052685 RepID=A0A8E2AI34_9APHY|nr:hypothetical protein OBBRIDRAFT_798679 [Obba rivulosa]
MNLPRRAVSWMIFPFQDLEWSLVRIRDVLLPILPNATLLVQGWLLWPMFMRRILSAWGIIKVTPPKPHLNADVLHCILRELPMQDLHATVLVCRQWAWVTQTSLYSSVSLDTTLKNAPLLARTMSTCPHLRPLVRSLTVMIGADTRDTTLVDWLHLLPEHTICEFKVKQIACQEDFASFIFQSPFLRSVRRFQGEGVFLRKSEHLESCFMLPHVRGISLFLSHRIYEIHTISTPPTLTRLSLILYEYLPTTIRLLSAVGCQLEHLDLDMGNRIMGEDETGELLHALEKYAHRLRHLTLRGLAIPEAPYLDPIGRHIPSLEYLHLGIGTFESTLFDNLPPNLRTLRLEGDYRVDFPLDELEDFILRVGRGESQCRSITIFFVGIHFCDMSSYNDLSEVCHRCGVDFQLQDWLRASQWWDH